MHADVCHYKYKVVSFSIDNSYLQTKPYTFAADVKRIPMQTKAITN